MPKVTQYQPGQVQSQVVSQPLARSAPAAAFGGDVASGLASVAQASFNMKKRIDTTSAEEAMVQFERDKNNTFFNPDTGYFNTQGKNAYDNSVATTKSLDDLKKSYGETLNPEAKRMFDSVADKHIAKSNVDIARHASKGLKAWEISTFEAQTENSLENASLKWSDREELRIQNVLGRQAIIDSSDMMGDSTEAKAEKLQTFESAFAGQIITAATVSSSIEGKEALEKYGDRLEGPDKIKMQVAIDKKVKVEKTQADANAAVLTASRLVDQYPNRSDINDEVDKIKDPELRKKTATEANLQFNRKKTAEKETENNFYDMGIDHFNQGGTAIEFQAANPKAWEGMSSKQRNNLLAGKHMTTDQIQFNNMLSLPRTKLAAVNPAEYADVFKPSDLKTLRSAVDKAKKGQSVTSIQTPAAKTKLIAEQFFGKQKSWKGNKAKTAKVQELMTSVQSSIEDAEDEKGGKLLPTELDTLLADFSRRHVAEREAFGFDFLASDLKIDISTAPPEDVAEVSKLVDKHGETLFQESVDYLESKGVPTTVDNILKAMRNVKVTK